MKWGRSTDSLDKGSLNPIQSNGECSVGHGWPAPHGVTVEVCRNFGACNFPESLPATRQVQEQVATSVGTLFSQRPMSALALHPPFESGAVDDRDLTI